MKIPKQVSYFILGYLILFGFCILLYGFFVWLKDIEIFSDTFDRATIITNLLIWSATLYAPLVAVIILDNWRVQSNKLMLSKEAQEVWKQFVEIDKSSSNIDLIYSEIEDHEILKETQDYLPAIKALHKKIDNALVDFHYFKEMCKDKNDILNLYMELYGPYRDYRSQTEKYENEEVREYYSIDNSYREIMKTANQNIRNYLSQYIHV